MKDEIKPDSFQKKTLSILELKERSIRLRELACHLLELARKIKAQPMPWEFKMRTMESLERAANNLALAGAEIGRGAEMLAQGTMPFRPDAQVDYEGPDHQEKKPDPEKPNGSR